MKGMIVKGIMYGDDTNGLGFVLELGLDLCVYQYSMFIYS